VLEPGSPPSRKKGGHKISQKNSRSRGEKKSPFGEKKKKLLLVHYPGRGGNRIFAERRGGGGKLLFRLGFEERDARGERLSSRERRDLLALGRKSKKAEVASLLIT